MSQRELEDRGFLVVRGLLKPDEVEACIRRLETLSGRTRELFAARRPSLLPGGISDSWTRPDGVSSDPDFWPVIFNPRLVAAVRDVLGSDVRYLQHSDLHVGFSAVTWHRDCVNRRFGHGGDWNESLEPYRLVRVGIYLQAFAESRFALRLVPGSHRSTALSRERKRVERRQRVWSQAVAMLAGRDPLAGHSVAIATDPGDAVIFDPRVLHSGSPIIGPKYSVFLAYGAPGRHFQRHAAYYRYVRRELGYGDLHPDLVARLRSEGLYADVDDGSARSGAYVPSFVQRLLGRYVRPGAIR